MNGENEEISHILNPSEQSDDTAIEQSDDTAIEQSDDTEIEKKVRNIFVPVKGHDLEKYNIDIDETVKNYIVSVQDFNESQILLGPNLIGKNPRFLFHQSGSDGGKRREDGSRIYYDVTGEMVSELKGIDENTSVVAQKVKKIDLEGKFYAEPYLSAKDLQELRDKNDETNPLTKVANDVIVKEEDFFTKQVVVKKGVYRYLHSYETPWNYPIDIGGKMLQ